ncbi:hypothetical protein MPSI1_003364 [Malassezia psittaci]|uniref:Uncharacterized protein n=1 Tax=Malassezia psittaci TaxID=1821823 RepID=A0AAF0FDC8_9BASI|nr:hypothetical protein MPSI1_003364 [Malassezia psittaci]
MVLAIRQKLCADIGKERTAFSIECRIDVQATDKKTTRHLLALEDATLVSHSVEGLGQAFIEQHQNSLALHVGPQGGRFRVYLYISTKLTLNGPPFLVRFPVVRAQENHLQCTFHGYEHAPAVDASPRFDQKRWEGFTLHTQFASTHLLALQWAQNREDQACIHALRANIAQTNFLTLESVCDSEQSKNQANVVLDIISQVQIEGPQIQALAKQGVLTIEVDAHQQTASWDWLEVDGDPSLITTQDCDSFDDVEKRDRCATRSLCILVDAERVCGSFGVGPDTLLEFTVRGRCRVTTDFTRSSTSKVSLPTLRTNAEHHDRKLTIYPTNYSDELLLELISPLPQGCTSHMIGEGCLVTLSEEDPTQDTCVVALSKRLKLIEEAPSLPSTMVLTSIYHEVYPFKSYLRHVLDLEGFAPCNSGEQKVLLFASHIAPDLDQMSCSVNGCSAGMRIEPQAIQEDKNCDVGAVMVTIPATLRRTCPLSITLELRTPRSDALRLTIPRFKTPTQVPRSVLCVHGIGNTKPRMMTQIDDAHYEQGMHLIVTEFADKPILSDHLEIALDSYTALNTGRVGLLMLVLLFAVWMGMMMLELKRIQSQVKSLAINLDIDLDSGWTINFQLWQKWQQTCHYAWKDTSALMLRLWDDYKRLMG